MDNKTENKIPLDKGSYFVNSFFIGIEILTIFFFTWQSFFIPYFWLFNGTQIYITYNYLGNMYRQSMVFDIVNWIKRKIFSRHT